MTSALQNYYNDIYTNGLVSRPRGMETRGLFDQSFWFEPGEVFVRPKSNLAIGFVELLQFIAGTFNIKPFEVVAPNARLDLFTHQSAYGPRVITQLPQVIEELKKDPHSRRAVMMIAHPTDTPETLPCTLSMQFQLTYELIGDPYLYTIITMRSSDLVWGLPTDIIQFGGIAKVVANCVGANDGECVVNAGNAHIYEDTKLKEGEEYRLGGMFHLPKYSTLDEYRAWALRSLDEIENKERTTQQVFNYVKYPKKEAIERF